MSLVDPTLESGAGRLTVTVAQGQKLSDPFRVGNAKFLAVRFRTAPDSTTFAILAGSLRAPGTVPYDAIQDDDTGAAVASAIGVPSAKVVSLAKWAKYLAPFSVLQLQMGSNETTRALVVDIEFKY